MGWTTAELPDLRGRVALVTGANSGLGYQTAKELAMRGARVVLACRDAVAAQQAATRIRKRGGRVDTVDLDLADMDSVRALGEKWSEPLDLLINNAGVMAPPRLATTVDGFELQFGVNHLAHFVLTGLLLPALAQAPDGGRVVTLSSIAHHGGSRLVIDGNLGELYHPQHTYANSKLANLLFADQLQRELQHRGWSVTSTAAHPGIAATGLFSSREGMGAKLTTRTVAPVATRVAMQSPRAGARATLFAAIEARPGSYTGPQLLGETRGPIGPARRSALAWDQPLARSLWRVSEDLTGFRYDWDARPQPRPGPGSVP